MRVPTLAIALLKGLARRGMRLAATLRGAGWQPLEVYPYASLRLRDHPTAGKRTRLGRARLHAALREQVPCLDHPDASEHQFDAVVCADTARRSRQGLTRTVGDPAEGLMVILDHERLAARASGPEPELHVAESGVAYDAQPDGA